MQECRCIPRAFGKKGLIKTVWDLLGVPFICLRLAQVCSGVPGSRYVCVAGLLPSRVPLSQVAASRWIRRLEEAATERFEEALPDVEWVR